VFPGDSKNVKRGHMSRLASAFNVEFGTDATDKFRAAFCGKHSGQKEEIACLHHLRVRTERLGRHRKLDALNRCSALTGRAPSLSITVPGSR
jgi:hypothetical protein